MLTYYKKREYVQKGGVKCPYCGSTSLTGYSVDIEAVGAYQPISCDDCGKGWTDMYLLSGIEAEKE